MSEAGDPAAIGPFVVLRKLGEGAMGIVYAGFDVGLDRKVALKLIRRQLLDNGEVRTRMVREAQAMARLSHPNVVQVYQVGEHEDEIYVAMEYVEGQTLTSWLHAELRTWTVVLRTVISAGRGLAAAHAAGLVHRDFKPDNVLVGKDGRARVLDFGLVQTEAAATTLAVSDPRVSMSGLSQSISRLSTLPLSEPTEQSGVYGSGVRLTQVGKALGTPAYMSPEQHFGESAGPASDQFSFSITLYEALYGLRPFRGETWGEIKRQVRRGQVPAPPRDSPVPGRVFKVLLRGLAPTPDQRWPTLEAMLQALEHDPRRAGLRIAGVVALAGAAAAGSYAAVLTQRSTAEQCQGGASELLGAWDETREQAGEQAFARSGAAFAGDTWQRVRTRLDAYAGAWAAEHTRACETHASGTQSTHLFDLRTLCLARRRTYLSALVDVFATADRAVIENAVQATAALPSIASCGDVDALMAAVAPPDDPEVRAQVEALRARLARAAALEGTGLYTQGLELARAVRDAAEGLRYAPVIAEAALGEGSMLMAVARADEAQEALTHALRTAIEQGQDGVAAEAAAKRIFVVGDLLGRRAVALDGEAVAGALIERSDDDGRLAALLHNNLGAIYAQDGADERARAHYLDTIEILQRRPGAPDPLIAVVHHNLGGLFRAQGRFPEAREHYGKAVVLFSELLGQRHPLAAHPLAGMADVDLREGRLAAASDGYMQALTLMEAAYGPDHLYLLHPLVGLGQVRGAAGVLDEATQHLRRAVAIGERLGTQHPMYAEALEGLAERLVASEPAEARRLWTAAIAVHEAASGPGSPAIAGPALHIGRLAAAAKEWPAAQAACERALSLTTGAKDQVQLRREAALELARVLVAAGAPGERACVLVDELHTTLAAEDPLRGELAAVRPVACPGG